LPKLSEEAGVACSPDHCTSIPDTAGLAVVEAPKVEAVAQAGPAQDREGCLIKGLASVSPTWRGQATAMAVGSASAGVLLRTGGADSPSTTRSTR